MEKRGVRLIMKLIKWINNLAAVVGGLCIALYVVIKGN